MAEIDSQTRVILGEYLAGTLSIDDTRRELARLAWRLSNKQVTEANQTTAAASLFVAEYEAGHRDESELRDLFAALLLDLLLQQECVMIIQSAQKTQKKPINGQKKHLFTWLMIK